MPELERRGVGPRQAQSLHRRAQAQRAAVDPTPRLVRVEPGWQVLYDEQVREPGEVLEVDGATAAEWLHRGYAVAAASPKSPRRRST